MSEPQTKLLGEVEAFLRDRRMADSAFGKQAVNDWKFVKRLRGGANMTVATMEKVAEFMRMQKNACACGAFCMEDTERTGRYCRLKNERAAVRDAQQEQT